MGCSDIKQAGKVNWQNIGQSIGFTFGIFGVVAAISSLFVNKGFDAEAWITLSSGGSAIFLGAIIDRLSKPLPSSIDRLSKPLPSYIDRLSKPLPSYIDRLSKPLPSYIDRLSKPLFSSPQEKELQVFLRGLYPVHFSDVEPVESSLFENNDFPPHDSYERRWKIIDPN